MPRQRYRTSSNQYGNTEGYIPSHGGVLRMRGLCKSQLIAHNLDINDTPVQGELGGAAREGQGDIK